MMMMMVGLLSTWARLGLRAVDAPVLANLFFGGCLTHINLQFDNIVTIGSERDRRNMLGPSQGHTKDKKKKYLTKSGSALPGRASCARSRQG